MLNLAILALLSTPAVLGEDARTYEYSDDRLFTVVFSGSNVGDIATTKTTITGKLSTRERTYLTYTGEGHRPTGEASLDDTDETDPELDAEDLFSTDDDGVFIAMHEDDEDEEVSESGGSGSGGSETGASGSGSELKTESGSGGGSETLGTSGSGSQTSGGSSGGSGGGGSGSVSGGSGGSGGSVSSFDNDGAIQTAGIGAFFGAIAMALL